MCQGVTDCRTNPDGGVHCRRTPTHSPPHGWNYAGDDDIGFHLFYPVDGASPRPARLPIFFAPPTSLPSLDPADASTAPRSLGGPIWLPAPRDLYAEVCAQVRPATEAEKRALAVRLFVAPWTLDRLSVAFRPGVQGDHAYSWAIPERDGAGAQVGINLRHEDGRKLTYGHRGIFAPVPPESFDGAAVVFPEGFSDTAALLSIGVYACGRPSNTGGVEHLAAWCERVGLAAGGANDGSPLIVLGENDYRLGGEWPGRDGAERTATRLAALLRRPVLVSYPQRPAKDVREHLQSHAAEIKSGALDPFAIGDAFTESLLSSAQAFDAAGRLAEKPGWFFGGLGAPSEEKTKDKPQPVAATGLASDPLAIFGGEFPPPRDDLRRTEPYAKTELPDCESPIRLAMRAIEAREIAIFTIVCQRLKCDRCAIVFRQRWQDTVRHHLRELPDGQPLYRFYVPVGRLDELTRQLTRRRADHFRIDLGGERFLVIATAAPSDKLVAAGAIGVIDRHAATAQLCGAIATVQPRKSGGTADEPLIEKGAIASSRGWPLLNDTKDRPKKWRSMGPFDGDVIDAMRAAERIGIDPDAFQSFTNGYPLRGVTFPIPMTVNFDRAVSIILDPTNPAAGFDASRGFAQPGTGTRTAATAAAAADPDTFAIDTAERY